MGGAAGQERPHLAQQGQGTGHAQLPKGFGLRRTDSGVSSRNPQRGNNCDPRLRSTNIILAIGFMID
jgi:hypothetical protein